MLALVKEAAPIPPPAFHRAQARLGSALHIDALTDASTRCICSRCAVWPCVWPITDALLLCPQAQVARLGRTAKSPCYSLCLCARCGGFRIRICATGCVIGLPSLWRAVCRWARMAILAFLLLPNKEAWESCRGTVAGSTICPRGPDRSASSAHCRPRSHH